MALKEQLLDKAQKYVLKGYIDKALGEYKAAFDLDPRDISVRLKMGDLYVKSGKKTEAIKEYTEVAKANAQRGFYLKAIAVYKQALKLDESNMEIHYKLADLYVKQRLIADAISSYSHILSVFEKKGKTNEVLEIVKKMVEVDPDNIGVRLKLADLYQKMNFDKDALNEYSQIFDKLLSQGKLDVAEKIYVGLYNNNPKEPLVIKGLLGLYEKKGDKREQLRFAKALFAIYRDGWDTEAAKEVCSSVLKLKPEDPDAMGFMAQFMPAEQTPVEPPPHKEAAPARPAAEESEAAETPEPAAEAVAIEAAPAEGMEAPEAVEGAEAPLISLPEDIEISLEGFEEEGQAATAEKQGPEPEAVAGAETITAETAGAGGLDISEELFKAPVAEAGDGGAVAQGPSAEVEIELPAEIELTHEADGAGVEAATKAEEAVAGAEATVEPAAEAAAPERVEIEAEAAMEGPPEAEAASVETAAEVPVEAVQEPVEAEKSESEAEAPPEAPQGPVVFERVELEAEAAPEVIAPEMAEPVAEVAPEAAEGPLEAEQAIEERIDEAFEQTFGAEADVAPEAAKEPVEAAPEAIAPEMAEPAPEVAEGPLEAEQAIEERIEEAFEQTFGAEAEVAPEAAKEPVEAAPLEAASKAEEFAGEEITEEEIESEQISSAIDDINRGLEAVVEREAELAHEAALKDEGARPGAFAAEAGAEPLPSKGISGAAEGPASGVAAEERLTEREPEMPRVEEPQPEARKEEYVDLSAELGMEEALHELSGTWGEGESEEMVAEFKKGMGEQLGREDTETHYNLGIAYMEMGLYNEASMEFKIALKDHALEFDCYARLGLCAMHQANPDEAIVYYLKGLKVTGTSEEERKGIMYELALAYENAGKKEESLQIFKSIYGMDRAYREVAGKVMAAMPHHAALRGPLAPMIPLDDGLIEVELL